MADVPEQPTPEAVSLMHRARTTYGTARFAYDDKDIALEIDRFAVQRVAEAVSRPIAMILFCPACGRQHNDAANWENPPHRTHQCQGCGHLWRPAAVYTEGVADVALGTSDTRPPTRDKAWTIPPSGDAGERAREIEIVFKGKITSNVDFEATYDNIAAALQSERAAASEARKAERGAREALQELLTCAVLLDGEGCLPARHEAAKRQAQRALASTPAASERWQPIETAPAGLILGVGPAGYKVGERFDVDKPGVWDAVIVRGDGSFRRCTDWQPLPAPPLASTTAALPTPQNPGDAEAREGGND